MCYINQQGGREQEKWLEIQMQLNNEAISVCALTETHLRYLEQPPVIENFVWEESNRITGSGNGGGVKMLLIRRGMKWQSVNETCKEHLRDSGTWVGKKTNLGIANLWEGSDKNKQLVDCITSGVAECKKSGEALLVAVMNAHMEDLDGYTDYNGSLLVDLRMNGTLK